MLLHNFVQLLGK